MMQAFRISPNLAILIALQQELAKPDPGDFAQYQQGNPD
jgi:hypothetical protein